MKAIVKGYDQYTQQNFETQYDNVVSIQYAKGTIILTDMTDNVPSVHTYTQTSLDGNIIIF